MVCFVKAVFRSLVCLGFIIKNVTLLTVLSSEISRDVMIKVLELVAALF